MPPIRADRVSFPVALILEWLAGVWGKMLEMHLYGLAWPLAMRPAPSRWEETCRTDLHVSTPAALTRYHTPRGSHNRSLLSPGSGSWTSKIQRPAIVFLPFQTLPWVGRWLPQGVLTWSFLCAWHPCCLWAPTSRLTP